MKMIFNFTKQTSHDNGFEFISYKSLSWRGDKNCTWEKRQALTKKYAKFKDKNSVLNTQAKILKKSVSELSIETIEHVDRIFNMKEYDYAVNLLETLFSKNAHVFIDYPSGNREIYFKEYGITYKNNKIYICKEWFLFDSTSLLDENYNRSTINKAIEILKNSEVYFNIDDVMLQLSFTFVSENKFISYDAKLPANSTNLNISGSCLNIFDKNILNILFNPNKWSKQYNMIESLYSKILKTHKSKHNVEGYFARIKKEAKKHKWYTSQ